MPDAYAVNHWRADCDVAIIVALREELEAADIFLDSITEPLQNDLGLTMHRRKLASKSGRHLDVITMLIDDQGPEHAAIATTRFLDRTAARLVVLLGISGRVSSDCRLGDVVLASLCDNSLYRAKKKAGHTVTGGREWPIDSLSKPLAAILEASPPYYAYHGLSTAELEDLRARSQIRKIPRTFFGPICTTPFVVDDPDFSSWLQKSRNRHILATDMESAAVVQAAYESGIVNGKILVIRGISDLADGAKADSDAVGAGVLRRIAMQNAAQLASHCISNLISFDSDPPIPRGHDRNAVTPDIKLASYKETLDLLSAVPDDTGDDQADQDLCTSIAGHRRRMGLIDRQIGTLAQSSYRLLVRKEIDEYCFITQAVSPVAQNLLVAIYIMDHLTGAKGISENLVEVLSKVYPQRINRFCKAMLTVFPDERRLVDTLIATYETKPHRKDRDAKQTQDRAKAHICYLLGRLRTPQQKKRATEALVRWRAAIGRNHSAEQHASKGVYQLDRVFGALHSPAQRLLIRTICISLVLLEHKGESEIYVRACLRNREFDSLNRGFHLEYYGDIDYDPGELMNNMDDGQDFPNTFRVLMGKLLTSYSRRTDYALRDIELQTLLSLSQYRLASARLRMDHHRQLAALLAIYSDSRLSSIKLLQAYCAMMREHLAITGFKRGDLIRKIFELKKLPRTGWNDKTDHYERQTQNPESVLSHTAGGLVLIHFLLPERLSSEDRSLLGEELARPYSKSTIAEIFLAHDLAEAYTGDLTPEQRNDVTKAREREVNSALDLHGTYTDFHHFGLFRLWEDFENGATINGKIAKEIDALENLMQLTIERTQAGNQISDYDQWRDDLVKRISTPVGKRILELILE